MAIEPLEAPQAISTTMPPARGVSRRRVLQAVGGACVVMVGGTLYRAHDQGVFNTGQGPAYNAWRVWDAEAGGVPLALVRAAVLATNAHNTQPWLFHVSSDRIDLYAALDRNIGTIDSLRREMYISLGCALENLALAAVAHGFAPVLQLMPDPLDQTFVASIDLAPSQNAASPLYAAIPARHTDRAAYATQMVASETLAAMESLIELPSVSLVWFTSTEEKRTFSDLTLRATEAIIADPAQAADDFAWYRTSWNEVQTRKDGITLDAAGIGNLLRVLGKLVPVSREQSGQGWLTATRETQLPTAAAFGTLAVSDSLNNAQRIQAGRMWQRMHLWATTQGIAIQPLNQVVERAEREQTAGFEPEFTRAIAALVPDSAWHMVMPFRIGYPTQEAFLSPRRPAEEVVFEGH
jgi:nitroreductase